jgi:hypothetical protein
MAPGDPVVVVILLTPAQGRADAAFRLCGTEKRLR